MVEVNLLGTFQVTQVFGALMAQRGGGSIINIGSLYASVSPDPHFYDHLAGNAPFLKSPAYGASKAGVVNLTKFFATHWAGAGVRVNTLSPGGVLGRAGRAVQGQVRRARAAGPHGGGRGSQGPAGLPRVARLVVRDRTRAAGRRRVHGVVSRHAWVLPVIDPRIQIARRRTRPAADGRTFAKVDPATGTLICRVARSSADDVEQAVAAAKQAQPAWARADRRQARRHPARRSRC